MRFQFHVFEVVFWYAPDAPTVVDAEIWDVPYAPSGVDADIICDTDSPCAGVNYPQNVTITLTDTLPNQDWNPATLPQCEWDGTACQAWNPNFNIFGHQSYRGNVVRQVTGAVIVATIHSPTEAGQWANQTRLTLHLPNGTANLVKNWSSAFPCSALRCMPQGTYVGNDPSNTYTFTAIIT